MFRFPDNFRMVGGMFAEFNKGDKGGYFLIKTAATELLVKGFIDYAGREVVCTTIETRLPTCEQLLAVKHHFWDESDVVLVDNDPFIIFMYRPPEKDRLHRIYPPGMMSYLV